MQIINLFPKNKKLNIKWNIQPSQNSHFNKFLPDQICENYTSQLQSLLTSISKKLLPDKNPSPCPFSLLLPSANEPFLKKRNNYNKLVQEVKTSYIQQQLFQRVLKPQLAEKCRGQEQMIQNRSYWQGRGSNKVGKLGYREFIVFRKMLKGILKAGKNRLISIFSRDRWFIKYFAIWNKN